MTTSLTWNVIGLVVIIAVVAGPLIVVLLLAIANEDEEA